MFNLKRCFLFLILLSNFAFIGIVKTVGEDGRDVIDDPGAPLTMTPPHALINTMQKLEQMPKKTMIPFCLCVGSCCVCCVWKSCSFCCGQTWDYLKTCVEDVPNDFHEN